MKSKEVTHLRILSIATLLALLTSTMHANACANSDREICAAGSAWYTANAATVSVGFGAEGKARYELTIPDQSSLSIQVDNTARGKSGRGSIMLVGGKVMLTKGLQLERGYEIDALDSAALSYQLAISLLSQAVPDGPDKLGAMVNVDVQENHRALKLSTQSASARFSAPWKLVGHVERLSPEKVRFDLKFTFSGEKDTTATLSLEGDWIRLQSAPVLDKGMLLEGWKAYSLGPLKFKQGESLILDYGAQADPRPLHTLGELEEALQKEKETSRKTRKSNSQDGDHGG